MKEFELTSGGYYVDGVRLEIGARIKAESLPVTLVNKAVEVESVELEAPRRGRPPKDKE